MKRREFIQTTAGLASGMLLLKSKSAFGYEANSSVRHGAAGLRQPWHPRCHIVLAEHRGAGRCAR